MSDIWSGVGQDQGGGDGEWLYRRGSEVRGPVPHQMIVQKLLAGELGIDTQVSREGSTEFHPITKIAAFSSHVAEAKERAQARSRAKTFRVLLMIAVPAIAALAGGGYLVWQEVQQRRAEAVAKREAVEKELAEQRKREAAMPQMGLVALVSLGTEEDVKIRGSGPAPKKAKTERRGGGNAGGAQQEEELVSTCKLSQGDIFGTLKKHLGKINVCVEDEKTRDTQGLLPPSLELSFVVTTSGKVVEFEIGDRHYRKGPMNNCLVKSFNTIEFPSSTGANCPVTIPIKIGK